MFDTSAVTGDLLAGIVIGLSLGCLFTLTVIEWRR